MNNEKYWKNRKVQEMFRYMASAEDAADEIAKVYLKASRYISFEMEHIFERFMKKHKLSENDARRLIQSLQDKTSIDEMKRALKAFPKGSNHQKILAELESVAYQARLERLKQLQNELDRTMQQVYNQEKAVNTKHYVDLANEAYYRSIFYIQQLTGLGFSFSAIDEGDEKRIINSRWSGANYSERIWKNTQSLARDLKEELLINLLTGRTDREAAEIIANKYAQGASNARRLVRTESCNLVTQMDMLSYEECGIETYIFTATLDVKTSTVCRELDRKRFPVAEQQAGKNCPPMHPWCRSTTICDISPETLAQMKRRARDPETGKTYMVPADMTYKQWHEQYVEKNPDKRLAERKQRNKKADNEQFQRYRKILGKDAPETLDSFQTMKYTDSEKWKILQQEYKDVRRYEKIISDAEKLNIKGKPIKKINRIDLSDYVFAESHINKDRKHGTSKEQAQKWVNEAVAAYSRWNGDVTIYISQNGASVINLKEKTISTAYSSNEYDEKFRSLLEVLEND